MFKPLGESKGIRQKRRRFAANFLAVIIIFAMLLSLAACSSESAPAVEGAPEKELFRVGMECAYSPFNWTQLTPANGGVRISGTDNQFANGYDVQIAKRIAEEMGKELLVVKLSWEGLIPSLNSGQIDAIAAGMSATEDRKLEIDFSDNYYYSDLVLVVKSSSQYASALKLNDLSGAKVTAQLGTLHYDVINQIEGVKKQQALKDFPNMIIALQTGTIDGYISERPGALSAVAANSDLTFVDFPLGEGFIFDDAEVSIGVGLKKNNPILADINAALEKISPEEREEIMQIAIQDQPSDSGVKGFWNNVVGIIYNYWPHFLRGAGTTLVISLLGTIIGLIIGLLVATYRSMPPGKKGGLRSRLHRLISILLGVYIEVFRGTPMMVQAMVFYYGFSALTGRSIPPFLAGIIILSINTGAYMSEVVRGGIDSVDKGQMEAGKAIGMTHRQTMLSVVLPQAIRNILPATGNEFVINIKDTSVFNVIAVNELYYAASDVQANTLKIFETFLFTAVIYLVLTFTVTRILRAVERKMDGPENYALTSSSMPATVELHQKQGR